MSQPKFDEKEARKLLSSIGQIHLCAIHPAGLKIEGKEFGKDIDAAIDYARSCNDNGHNIYWSVNITRAGYNKKPSKDAILGARFAHVDIDPPKTGGAFDKKAIIAGLEELKAPPSFIIDSGGGINVYWRLDDYQENLASIEAINIQIRDFCSADHCWNIDRIMRLPGTVNWPDAKKKARGRRPVLAKFAVEDDGVIYAPHELSASFPAAKPESTNPERVGVALPDNVELIGPDDLGLSAFNPLRLAIMEPPGDDRSGDGLAAARLLANAGHTDEQIIGVLLNPDNTVSTHFLNQRDPKRAAARCLERVRSDGPASGEALRPNEHMVQTMSAEDHQNFIANMRAKVKRDMVPVSLSEDDEPKSAVPQKPVERGDPKWLTDLGDNPIAGFVRHVCQTAASPQPWVTLGAALTTFGTAAGRRYASPTNLRTNIYAIGICDSGGGKDHPIKKATKLMVDAGLQSRMGGSKIASGQAMITDLTKSPALMYAIDEVGFLISSAADRRRAPKHSVDIIDNLTFLYSQASSTFLGTSYANQDDKKGGKPREVIEEPCLSLFGVTTPNVFWGSLSSSNVMDGSLARMIIFQSENNYPDPQYDINYSDIPQWITDSIAALEEGAVKRENLQVTDSPTVNPKAYIVPFADDAAKYMARAMRDEQTDMLRKHEGGNQTSVIARLAENATKIALVVAVAENPKEPAITKQHLQWGMSVARQSVDSLMEAIRTTVADNEQEAAVKKLLKIIVTAGPEGITRTKLKRQAQFLVGRKFTEAVDDLGEAELIMQVELPVKDGHKGPKPKKYVAVG